MAKYIDSNSNITFNNVPDSIGTVLASIPVSKKNNYTFNDEETEITSINSKVFNAVDVDWNGAVLFLKSFCKCSMMLQRLTKN